MATSSGLAATCLIVNLLKAGDHILCCDDVYGGLSVCLFVCLYYSTIKSCNFGSSLDTKTVKFLVKEANIK